MESMGRFHQSRPISRRTCRFSWSAINLLLMMIVMMMVTDPRPSLALDVNMAVLLPFDDSYMFSYRRVAPAIEKAISYLNNNTPLLRKHRLHVRYNDTKCNIAVGMDRAINFFIRREVHVFLGPVCDFSLAPVARQAGFWNIPTISGGAMARDFVIFRNTTYTMLTRVGPVSFGSLSTLLSSMFHHNRWRRMKLLYYKDGVKGQDYLMKGFCHLSTEFVVYDLKEREPNLHVDYYRLEENNNLGNVLKEEVGFDFAVVVLCASPDSVREIMIKAHELNFDNGEYVFFNIDLFTSKNASERPWYRQHDTEERNEKARKAYEALMTVTLRKPTSPEYRLFSKQVKMRAEQMFAADNFTYGEEEVNSFVGAFHDAVILYALALNESLEANVSITDGSEITRRMWNRTFQGITGTVSIDANGDRNADYSLLDLDPVQNKFQVVANYYGNRKKYEPAPDKKISWAGGRTEAPPDTPVCGFDGSKCPPEEPFPEYGIVIIVLGTIIIVVLVAAFFIYRWKGWKDRSDPVTPNWSSLNLDVPTS